MEWAKLNVFQRLVRQWDALHPYNAAQVMHLAGSATDAARFDGAWRETLDDLGLGKLQTLGDRYRFELLNGDVTLGRVTRVCGRTRALDEFISDELNRRFEPGGSPLRPFILRSADDHTFFAGVIYHHWVADSASIRLLLREWFYRAYDPSRARRAPLRIAPSGYWPAFGPGRRGWRLDDGVLTSLRWSSRMKRARRIESSGFDDYRTHFTTHRLPVGIVEPLRRASRAMGVTLNDVFLAAVAQVCDANPCIRRTPRRQDLALGTIVDLRARAPRSTNGANDLDDVFGLFLGFTSVTCRPRDLQEWDRLVHSVAAQGRAHKRAGAPEASMIRMLAGLVAHRMLGPQKIKQFYRKRLPLAGGVSNVNLNGSWAQQYHPAPLLDYVRVSPSGPMMPLVFTPTTLGARLNFGLTCRTSVVSPPRAAEMSEMFINRLLRVARTRAGV
jgi:hypothetical protein